MAALPPVRSKRLRDFKLDPSKGGHSNSSGGDRDVTSEGRRRRSGGGREGGVRELSLELSREGGEGLGMVLGVEEADEVTSGRRVVVKSVTPGGAASRAAAVEVPAGAGSDVPGSPHRQGFRVEDVVLRVDEHVLDDLDDDDCMGVLQDVAEDRAAVVVVVVVRREGSPSPSPSPSPSRSPPDQSSPSSRASPTAATTPLSTLTMTSAPVSAPTGTPQETQARQASQAAAAAASASKRPPSATTTTTPTPALSALPVKSGPAPSAPTGTPQPSHVTPASRDAAAASCAASKRPSEPGTPPSTPSPQPPPRKVRRQTSSAAQLAEKGLAGFAVRRVTVHRPEGQGLGLGIVPSCGATRYYYQVSAVGAARAAGGGGGG